MKIVKITIDAANRLGICGVDHPFGAVVESLCERNSQVNLRMTEILRQAISQKANSCGAEKRSSPVQTLRVPLSRRLFDQKQKPQYNEEDPESRLDVKNGPPRCFAFREDTTYTCE
jgi:hypothetical protein